MKLGVPRETFPGERRVAVVPAVVAGYAKAGIEVVVERGAGASAGFPDAAYEAQGATIATRDEVFACDIVAQVRAAGANPAGAADDAARMRPGQLVIGFAEPLTAFAEAEAVAARGARLIAMELVPRITRAQSMDALSSMATIAGYKAVLLAAATLPRMFPMLNTAAGTVAAARVFVIGAGVAGLQAIATAKRLGARVEAYDVRPAVKEQIQSLGARFVEVPLEAADAQDAGGYARAQDEDFYRKQRELLHQTVAGSDVVVTTAAIPGRQSPVLVTTPMVEAMAPGSVVVDLAAERGGNCELTRPDETVVHDGVTIIGPTNLPSTVPYHASQMYARNVLTLVQHLVRREKGPDGKPSGPARVVLDFEDEITRDVVVTDGGSIVSPRVRQLQETR
ncbi:MAG: Re/Si-specific NAD(P)(+) transhydrogenase subunit alpha [Acidobacteriota bacterium]|jgi:NAD(P) transhydrogenase subunit alpha|nr:MAG: Re/Si-specific NAD(P)(+) transhydrogenase subunit alpha [Acidobacteriota bacterium]